MRNNNRRNAEWETPKEGFTWDHVVVEVLMDIRGELQAIRRLLECPNVSKGMVAMATLERHMKKRFPLKKPGTKP